MADDSGVQSYAAEADETRDRIASTIDELQERLSPRRILGDAVEGVQAQGTELFDQARGVLKAHPLAIGAVGAAVGLALFARSKISGATVNLGDDFRGYTDYDDGYSGGPLTAYDDEPADAPEPVKPRRGRLAAVAGHIDATPLVSIIVGLTAGAVLGALFPATESEARLFGETGDRVARAAKAAAKRAREELDSHGLSVETARDRAGDVAAKAKAAVSSVVEAAKQEFHAGTA